MSQHEQSPAAHTQPGETRETETAAPREAEQGDVAEPDAPTDVEENDGLNTVLDGSLGTGVQTDADNE